MRDIFVSYVEEEGRIAAEIVAGLEAAGYSAWYYERDSEPGASYLLQTSQAIKQCQAVVLVISPNSVKSHQVTKEVIRAHESNKQFIPLRVNITDAEFKQCQPEWEEALGAAASVGLPPEGVAAVLPRLLRGLQKMGIQPNTAARTGPLKGAANERKTLSPATETLKAATVGELAGPLPQFGAAAMPKRALVFGLPFGIRLTLGKRFVLSITVAIAVIAFAGWLTFRSFNRQPPLFKGNFTDKFETLENWVKPAQGWSVGNNWLEIKGVPEAGYLAKERFGDFTMAFQVKLLNDQGAAWALRVKKTNYLLRSPTPL